MSKTLGSFLGLLFLALSATEAGAEATSLQDIAKSFSPAPQAVIYTAKDIITLDPDRPRAEAVAVVGGKILAVGTREELKGLVGDQPVRLDETFKDKVLVPGLIDQHLHPWLSSLTMTSEVIAIEDWDLPSGKIPAAKNKAEYRERLVAAERALEDPDEPLVTWGFHDLFHGEVTRKDLDAISTDRQIIVWHRSAHEFILNTKAMEENGVTKEYIATLTESAKAQTDFDKGRFWEQGAILGALPKIAHLIATPERMRAGLELTESYLHQAGVATAAEPGGLVSKPLRDATNAVFSDDATPFRFYFIPDGKTMAQTYITKDGVGPIIEKTEELLDWGEGKTAFLPKQVKLLADGAIFSQLMKMKDGYLDGHHGEWIIDPDVFAQAFRAYWDAGYQIHIHQNGDEALEFVLDNLESNMRRNPRHDHRTTIVHFGYSSADQVPRIKALGAIVSAKPYYLTALSDKYGKVGVGPERSDYITRVGDVVDQGIPLSLHSDMPMAPAQPLFLMWAAVNRVTPSGRVSGPDQKLSVEDALKAVTIDAAYSLRLENEIGSIEPGKLANFTVLEASPFDVDPMKIKDIKIWGTVLEGRLQPLDSKTE
ncbi:MAG: amidohydrolase [Hyphomicrobium sp.]|nr:amidohydrolase [Hyphomicrobium sp.]